MAAAQIAFAFGALGSAETVPVLVRNMGTIEPALREGIMWALNKIGSREPLGEMVGMLPASDFQKRCRRAGMGRTQCESDERARLQVQKATVDPLTFLIDAAHLDAFRKVVDNEEDETIRAYFQDRLAAAQAAELCRQEVGCWVGKTKDQDPVVREKAYWELGRLGGDEAREALAQGLSDAGRGARAAAIFSYWKLGDPSVLPDLEAQLKREAGSADYIRVNEDLRRLYIDLGRRRG